MLTSYLRVNMSKSIIFNCSVKVENIWFYISLDKNFFESVAWPVSLHNHAAYEVHIIKNGEYIFHIDGREIALSSGSCCIIGPNVYHSKGNALSEGSCRYIFKFECFHNNSEDLGKGEELDIIECINMIDRVYLLASCKKEINLVEDIISEFKSRQIGYVTSINNLFSQLILTILRNVSGHRKSAGDTKLRSMDENRTTAIDGFFALNYMNNIYASDLAKLLNLSVRQLGRIMLKYYGLTFKQKLVQMRVFAAKDLLLNSNMTVSRIAETVGYNNTKYFSQAFKEIVGMTPGDFRKINRGINRGSSHTPG
jgi:AraC-like DNA-binding protein